MLEGGTPLDWRLSPLQAMQRWPNARRLFMLHSARPDARWSRYCVLAEPTDALRHTHGQTQTSDDASPVAKKTQWTHRPLTDLRRAFDTDAGRSLWLGYLGYTLGRSIEATSPAPRAGDAWPDFQLERCDGWLVHDNTTGRWSAHGSYATQGPPALDPQQANTADSRFTAGPILPDQPADEVRRSIRRVIDYIAAGDVFQANLAQRFAGPFAGSPRALYTALCERSPAWYGAYGELTRFTTDEPVRTLASISPELFLDCNSAGRVVTRPIKGTRPSSVSADELRDSDKDRAELAMIVDLMRNDLGRVCAYGSVRVDQPRTIESHPTVHHGVATISGRLHPGTDLVGLLRATLPGGSITGAPKVRAMQIIDELEPRERGVYCGAIGMLRGAQARLNIAIRTVTIEQAEHNASGRASVWAGAGIVADSDADAEYNEMLDKARVLRSVLETGSAHDRPTPTADAATPAPATRPA